MSFHKAPKYQIPALVAALQAHGMEHDKPSQLADAFRIGWVAAQKEQRQIDHDLCMARARNMGQFQDQDGAYVAKQCAKEILNGHA